MKKLILKKDRERSILRKHPWIFSGAVKSVDKGIKPGETIKIISSEGMELAVGFFSPESQIRSRIWSFDPDENIDHEFFRNKIQDAVKQREMLGVTDFSSGWRMVASEADSLPGLIADRYNNYVVCQFLSCGAEFWKKDIVEILNSTSDIKGIYERSDAAVREKEGLIPLEGPLQGKIPLDLVEIEEKGLKFLVDIKNGHKTGFYLDQKQNRYIVRKNSENKKVLNCFAYTGGFGISALKGGASHVTNIEYTKKPIEIIEKNIEINGLDQSRVKNIKGDVFKVLREYEEEKRLFDLIILDPPKFAESKKDMKKAARGYKDINRLAMKIVEKDGLIFTFSCSGLMDLPLFQKIIADAAVEAKRDVHILNFLYQDMDHPIKTNIPESLYLKGLLLKVT